MEYRQHLSNKFCLKRNENHYGSAVGTISENCTAFVRNKQEKQEKELHGTDITTDADRCSFTEHRLFTDFKVIFCDVDRRVPTGTYYCIRFYVTV